MRRRPLLARIYTFKAGLLELGRSIGERVCELTGYSDRYAIEAMIETRCRDLLTAFYEGFTGEGEIPTSQEATDDEDADGTS